MADTKKVYWDSCVWISLINQEAGRVENCQAMVEAARKGEVSIWTSSLSLTEVFKKKCSGVNGQIEGSKDPDFEAFIEQDFVTEVQVDHDIAVVARRLLRSNQQLKKPADAIHLATAVLYNLDEFHTYDGDNLLPLDGKIPRRDGVMLRICVPPPPKQGELALEVVTQQQPGDSNGNQEEAEDIAATTGNAAANDRTGVVEDVKDTAGPKDP